jgi:DnaJ-class molecular chaperone
MFVDYYEILEISIYTDEKEIKNAFRNQAIKWHPDKNNGKDTTIRMQLINEAYLILKDKEARAKYDIEYNRFKNYQTFENITPSKEYNYTSTEYVVKDEVLFKWMQNARKQAVELAKQTIKDFKDIGLAGAKAAAKESGGQFIAHIVITIIVIIIFSLINKCS